LRVKLEDVRSFCSVWRTKKSASRSLEVELINADF